MDDGLKRGLVVMASESEGGDWKLVVEAESRRSVDEASEDEEDKDLCPVKVVHSDILKYNIF